MILLLLLPILFYSILILWIAHHWYHNSAYDTSEQRPSTKVTVLIPFKNEQAHLTQLVASLKAQTYPDSFVNYLFINDHSNDNGEQLIDGFTVIPSVGQGKKSALKTGLKHAKGELVVTLDADGLVCEHWLTTIVSFYQKERSDLIICPVNILPAKSLWDKFQAIEFQSLVASAGGAALGGMPIMCNGANLAFKQSLVDTDEDIFNDAYVSGDDMFLLEFAKANKKTISYLKSEEAMVSTAPVRWAAFWKQRSRWTSKAGGYSDTMIRLVGLVVLLSNLSLLMLPFVSWPIFFLALVAKGGVDLLLLLISARFFATLKYLWLYPFLVLFYPFYVFVAVVRGLMFRG